MHIVAHINPISRASLRGVSDNGFPMDVASLEGVLGHMISHILQVQSKQSTSICTVYYQTNKSKKKVYRVIEYIHHLRKICLSLSVFAASFCLNLEDHHHLLLRRAQIWS